MGWGAADKTITVAVRGVPGSSIGGATVLLGTRNWETMGNDDTARTKKVNEYFRNGGRDTIVLPAREISMSEQLELIFQRQSLGKGGIGLNGR